jgi:hypothetical protein
VSPSAWRSLAVVCAAAYVLLVASVLRIALFQLLMFGGWLCFLLCPIGVAAFRLARLKTEPATAAMLAAALGYAIVGMATMIGSVVGGAVGMYVALALAAAAAWGTLLRGGTPRVPPAHVEWPVAALALAAALVHFALLPSYFSGVEPDGALRLAGIGADNFYLPFARQIVTAGTLVENPFYAGQPMLYHHFLTKFVVSSFWLTSGRWSDPFVTRLMMHFLFGTPLLIAGVALVSVRWTRSRWWTALLLALFVLPITAYMPRGGWSGIESMNAFWVIGIHSDMNYVFGLILLIAILLWFDDLDAVPAPDSRMLAGVLLLLAAATQVKFNFALAYGPVAALLVLWQARRRNARTVIVAAVVGCAMLAVVQFCAWHISRGFMGRGAVLAYGRMPIETLWPAVRNNAQDGLRVLEGLIELSPEPVRPVVVTLMYCVAYTPLFLFVPVHAISLLRRRAAPRSADVFLAGTALVSLLVVLWVIEPQFVWQISGHLHYLIPILAIAACARLIAMRSRWVMASAAAMGLVAIVGCAAGITSSRQFSFWATWTIDDPALLRVLARVKAQTPADAVLMTHGLSPLADEYVAMFTNRSIFAAPSFAYPDSYDDWAARQRAIASVGAGWPAVPTLDRSGLSGIPAHRAIVILGRVEHGHGAPPGATCEGDYCFWQPAS